MGMPSGIGVVDTLIGLPNADRRGWYEAFKPMLHDEGSKAFRHPAEYMYHETPNVPRTADSAGALLTEMDRFGIERGLVSIDPSDEFVVAAVREHPDRLSGSLMVDPNRGMEAVRGLNARSRRSASSRRSSCPPASFRRCRSTTRRHSPSTPSAWNWICPSS